MPYSSEHGKKLVDRALQRLIYEFSKDSSFFETKRILDIGAGSGTYSDRYSDGLLKREDFSWDAVEIWDPYIEKFGLEKKYDDVYVSDAAAFFRDYRSEYDVAFMGDVVEHMTKEEAVELVKMASDVCKLVVISVPIVHYPQGEYDGNPYEAHVKDDWSVDEVLETFQNIVSYGVEEEIGVFFVQGSPCEKDLRAALSPKIGVYAIGKDETMFASRFMASVTEADQVVVCDTGSTDGTYEFLSETAANLEFVTVSKISLQPFRFDDARNAAMSLLRPDIDVCVSIDFDEYMEPGWAAVLRDEATRDLTTRGKIVDRWNHRFKTVWNWKKSDAGEEAPSVSEHWHERVHTRSNYLWKLPVHEVLVKVSGGPEEVKWLGGFTQIQKPDTSKSRSSYLPMLEKSVTEDPSRWKTWSFLAGDLLDAGRHHEAFDAVERAKKCHGADTAYICSQKSRMHQQLGQTREAVAEMTNACVLAPHLREYKFYAARLFYSAGDVESAKVMFGMADAVRDRTYGYEYDPAAWSDGFEELRFNLNM